MPNPIGYKTLVNVEMGFLYVLLKLRLENSTQNENMKKNVLFSPLFLYNLALITHDATKSVNPSICGQLCQASWMDARGDLSKIFNPNGNVVSTPQEEVKSYQTLN